MITVWDSALLNADIVVVFAGLPDVIESEGYDRANMDLPICQNRIIAEVAKVQPNTVVVLHNGSPVETPWENDIAGILEMYLGGQGVGEACDRLLYGEVNPSGRLAETFPYRVQDNPGYLNFPGDGKNVNYGEDIFVGYRYYEAKELPVRWAFGHGLSYTSFAYGKSENKKVRIIVYTDYKNETDDQFALAHHLMTPKFDVKGIVVGHFWKNPQTYGEKGTAKASYDEIIEVLALMGLGRKYPVLRGR